MNASAPIDIRRLEGEHGADRVAPATVEGVRNALERAGAEFIPDGVRRRGTARANARGLRRTARDQPAQPARLQGQQILTDADLYDESGLPA